MREPNSGKRAILNLQKEKRVPAVWQAYQKLYWETKLKSLVNMELDAIRAAAISGGGDASWSVQRAERLQVQTRVTREQYEKESDEVKAEVVKYIEEKKNGGGTETPEALQQ